VADDLVASLSPGFRNEKHRAQWKTTLRIYAAPIWNKPVAQIETSDILEILRPVWNTKNETASRVRGRIERVLDAAAANNLRSGNNPARWRGNLSTWLGNRPKRVIHHTALPYSEVPAFVAELGKQQGVSALGSGPIKVLART
jgi:hypothetical protein